jgi:hypothetical protein
MHVAVRLEPVAVAVVRPYRPRPARVLNAAGAPLARRRVPSLDERVLLRAARKRSRASDFGDDGFRVGLRRLLRSLDEDAHLNLIGRLAARQHVTGLLVNRLMLEDAWKRHPQILDEDVRAPIFILGMPRTGTTLLQFLFACDRRLRSLSQWEATNPCPPPERATYDTDPRIAKTVKALRALDWMAPEFKAIHPQEATGPTECVALLAHNFLSMLFTATYGVSGYAAWHDEQDQRANYRYHRRVLQLLQWRCPGSPWVLKSPAHLFAVDALLEVYPDARFVQLHRDPLKVIASVCSLASVLHGATSDDIDPDRLGRFWPPVLADGLTRTMEARDRLDTGQFLDVQYVDLLRDPIATMRHIYGGLGLALDDGTLGRMRAHMAANPQTKHGRHRYTLSQFGLTADTEAKRFAAYCERFDVVPE